MATTRRGFLLNGIRLAGGLAIAACAPGPATTPGASPRATATAGATRGVLRVGTTSELPTIGPYHHTNVPLLQIANSIFDGVTARDKDYALQDRVAESWKLVDPMTWEFKLRDGIKFHNGDDLTAEDVQFLIEYNNDANNKTLYPTTFESVDRIEILDKLTFRIHTNQPDPFIADKLSVRPSYIVPANHFLKVGLDEFSANPIGSGPYMFKDAESGVSMTLAANPNYWRAEPTASEIIFYSRPDLAARVAGLKAGELNFINDLTFDQFDDVNATSGLKAVAELTTTITNWPINATVPPLDNKLVRQALNISIDRKGLNDSLFKGTLQLCNGPVMPYEFGYVEDWPPIAFDPEGAKRLLDQAGYNGETIVFEFGGTDQAVVAVQEGWRQVGLNVELRTIDGATAAQKRREKSFLGIYTGGTASYYGDPNSSIWRQMAPGGTHRYLDNEEFDRLGEEQATSLDQDRRRAIWRRMSEIMNDEVPWLNLYSSIRLYGTGPDVSWEPGYSVTDEFHPERLKFK